MNSLQVGDSDSQYDYNTSHEDIQSINDLSAKDFILLAILVCMFLDFAIGFTFWLGDDIYRPAIGWNSAEAGPEDRWEP